MKKLKNTTTIDPRILEIASKITAKRPKVVVDHIIKNGFITTEELEQKYGYKHPPRAARDVREQGLPLETFRVKASDGRSIGAYRFANPDEIINNRIGGRQIFSKEFKELLIKQDGEKCGICNGQFEHRYLQIDHRIPYEVAGDVSDQENRPEDFMLVCGTCNRKKSWSCEQCVNWQTNKDQSKCKTCYWASPHQYQHLAGKNIGRVEIIFEAENNALYETIKAQSNSSGKPIHELLIELLKKSIK